MPLSPVQCYFFQRTYDDHTMQPTLPEVFYLIGGKDFISARSPPTLFKILFYYRYYLVISYIISHAEKNSILRKLVSILSIIRAAKMVSEEIVLSENGTLAPESQVSSSSSYLISSSFSY